MESIASDADILLFGINRHVYDGSYTVLGITYYPIVSNSNLRYDIVITPEGQTDSRTR
jgi:hypothetical protein